MISFRFFNLPAGVTGIISRVFLFTCVVNTPVLLLCIVLFWSLALLAILGDRGISLMYKMKDGTKCPSFGPSWLSVF